MHYLFSREKLPVSDKRSISENCLGIENKNFAYAHQMCDLESILIEVPNDISIDYHTKIAAKCQF